MGLPRSNLVKQSLEAASVASPVAPAPVPFAVPNPFAADGPFAAIHPFAATHPFAAAVAPIAMPAFVPVPVAVAVAGVGGTVGASLLRWSQSGRKKLAGRGKSD